MKNSNETTHSIIDDTRHSIIDAIIAFGYIVGDLQYHEFAKKVCPTLSDSVLCDVARHMDRFDDYSHKTQKIAILVPHLVRSIRVNPIEEDCRVDDFFVLYTI